MITDAISLGEIGARLRAARESRGLSQDVFGSLGGVTRISQANYEGGKRPCNVDYLANLATHGVDVAYILTGEQSSAKMPRDVAEYATLSPRLADEQRAALLLLASGLAGRRGGSEQPAIRNPSGLPPSDALEHGFRAILAACRDMDEAGLARELAEQLPALLGKSPTS